jgi:general secretion pathway protein H
MPISTPNKQAGFTLVELMVVLFLIGLAAGAVMLTVGSVASNGGSQAEKFAARIAALRDRAVVEGRPLALWVRPSGYGFERRGNADWQPLDAKPFTTEDWKPPLRANIAGGQMVRVAFDQTGIPSAPLDISLVDGAQSLRVTMDVSGNVNVVR